MTIDLLGLKLKILVFGPSSKATYSPGFEADLSKKRTEIKEALKADGHEAVFPEDLMSGSIDPALGNAYVWEQMLVREYDMVVNLVGSPGAIAEMSLFNKDQFALKAVLFFNDTHTGGFPFQHAKMLQDLGAALHTFSYPVDLTSCNLMTKVREKVRAVRAGKFFAS